MMASVHVEYDLELRTQPIRSKRPFVPNIHEAVANAFTDYEIHDCHKSDMMVL